MPQGRNEMVRRSLIVVSVLALMQGANHLAAAAAQDSGTTKEKEERTARVEQETAYITAVAARDQARTARIQANAAPLTSLAGEGKVTLGEGAGTMEAWLLSSSAISQAGIEIARLLPTDKTYIVLAGDEALNLRPLLAFRAEGSAISTQLSAATTDLPGSCGRPGRPGPSTSQHALPLVPLLGALGSMLRTDTEVRNLEVAASDRLLALAVARRLNSRAILPSAIQMPATATGGVNNMLVALESGRAKAQAAKACFSGLPRRTPAENAALAAVTAALDRLRAFQTALTTADANGRVPLADLFVAEAVAQPGRQVLRVYLDKVGGTLLTRRNVWTAFGASAIGLTGGVVASYSASDPVNGSSAGSGILNCSTRMTSLRGAHRRAEHRPDCQLVADFNPIAVGGGQ
jgi:hypothetical protein